MKETKLLPPVKGIPYTHDEIITFMANMDDTRYYKNLPNKVPPPEPRLPILKRTAQAANWSKANILRFSLSLVQP